MPLARPNLPPIPIRHIMTLTLAVAGTWVFWVAHLPLPFLFGPMSACLIAALLGARLAAERTASQISRTVLGVAVGASLTVEVLHRVPQMAASVAFVPLYIVVIGVIGVPYFNRICKFDLATSYYAAMPGGLQDMITFGKEAGADVRALSLIHATRILVIITVVPFIIVHVFDLQMTHPMGQPALDIALGDLALMTAAALIGWKGGERIGLFGAPIIGPLIVAGALSLSGLIHSRPPAEAIKAAQFFIGMGIGVGYVGVTLYELRRVVVAGIFFVLILAVLAVLMTLVVVELGVAKPLEGLLSFAPGGQAEMTVLALVSGADLGFVVVHHLTRIMLVISGTPIVGAIAGLRKPREAPDRDKHE